MPDLIDTSSGSHRLNLISLRDWNLWVFYDLLDIALKIYILSQRLP